MASTRPRARGRVAVRDRERPARCALRRGAGRLRYEAGEVAVAEGDRGSALFVVDSGALSVCVGQGASERIVSSLGAGDVFGEMALLTGERRVATVRAQVRAEVLQVEKEDLFAIVSRRPGVIKEISTLLAARQRALRADAECAAARSEADSWRGLARHVRGFLLG